MTIAGHGGNGLPKYGGVGGQGGAIYFITKEKATLKRILSKHARGQITAGNGEDSNKLRIVGKKGQDVEVQVPIGVRVINDQGKVMCK